MTEAANPLFSPTNTFLAGFLLGVVFLVLALWSHWKTKREFARYRRHLSDKLELDSRNVQELNKEPTSARNLLFWYPIGARQEVLGPEW